MHFDKHAFDAIISVKNARRRPVIIAPNRLVATNSTARSNREVSTVPISAMRSMGKTEHTHPRTPLLRITVEIIGVKSR